MSCGIGLPQKGDGAFHRFFSVFFSVRTFGISLQNTGMGGTFPMK
jgi:hypothetical protein